MSSRQWLGTRYNMEDKLIFRIVSSESDDSFRLTTNVENESDYTSLVAGIAQILYEEPEILKDVAEYIGRLFSKHHTAKEYEPNENKIKPVEIKEPFAITFDTNSNKIKS